MPIQQIGSDLVRPLESAGTRSSDRKQDRDASARSGRPDRADRVGLSAEGLALAAQAQSVETDITPERLADVQAKVAKKFYDTPGVAEEVARRLLASGDL